VSLAQVAIWLTCSGAAFGLNTAWMLLVTTGRSALAMLSENSLGTLDATAVGLCLCAGLYASSLLLDLTVREKARSIQAAIGDDRHCSPGSSSTTYDRALVVVRYARRGLGAVACALVGAALMELRSRYLAIGSTNENRVWFAVYSVLDHLWTHLAVVFAAIALLAWLSVLMEGALSRRQAWRRVYTDNFVM
jgi:hypothetical protein